MKIVYTEKGKLSLNELQLNRKTSLEKIKKILGQPSSQIEKHTEVSYLFESKGVLVVFKKGKFGDVFVNFNWDGDQRMPSTTYTEELVFGSKLLMVSTKSADLDTIDWIEYQCISPQMCFFNNEKTGAKGLVGFGKEYQKIS